MPYNTIQYNAIQYNTIQYNIIECEIALARLAQYLQRTDIYAYSPGIYAHFPGKYAQNCGFKSCKSARSGAITLIWRKIAQRHKSLK